jgi:hypothetical protein
VNDGRLTNPSLKNEPGAFRYRYRAKRSDEMPSCCPCSLFDTCFDNDLIALAKLNRLRPTAPFC